jgi:prolyl-tRNA synthetase
MRYSRMLIPTVKEIPADAEVASHQLMIRAGLCRKVASGTYTYLPLGWRSLLKIIAIVGVLIMVRQCSASRTVMEG